MLKRIQKIPAGTFLVPMIIGMIFGTLWPDLFVNIGGTTAATFSTRASATIVGLVTFASGASIDLKTIGPVIKRHGVLMLLKMVGGIILGLLFLSIFGQDGILGIPAMAFIIVITSINPSLWLAINQSSGNEDAAALMGVAAILTLPIFPQIVYSIGMSGQGGTFDFMPIFASLLPLIIGLVLGNLDGDMREFFTPLIGILIPFLGWTTGQGMNLFEAINSGFSGILMALLLTVINFLLVLVDKFVLKKDGAAGIAFLNSGGMSLATVPVLVAQYPELAAFSSATGGIILACSLISSFLNPALAKPIMGALNTDKEN